LPPCEKSGAGDLPKNQSSKNILNGFEIFWEGEDACEETMLGVFDWLDDLGDAQPTHAVKHAVKASQ
jgi:hypothetical protein